MAHPGDFQAPVAEWTPHVVLDLGPQAEDPAHTHNRILDAYGFSLLPHAQAQLDAVYDELGEDARRGAELLCSYVLSGQLPAEPQLVQLIARANQAHPNPPVHEQERRDRLLHYVASPGWRDWAGDWAGDLGRINARELSLGLATKFLQSSLAAGLQKACFSAPVLGACAGLAALLLPLFRQGLALYQRRQEDRALAQIGRLLQISGLCLVLILAPSLGGWRLLAQTGASALSYLVGAFLGDAFRLMLPSQAKHLSAHTDGPHLLVFSGLHAGGIYATSVAQQRLTPNVGARTYSQDPQTGAITGQYAPAQVLEAVLEAGIKQLIQTNASVIAQYHGDRSKPPPQGLNRTGQRRPLHPGISLSAPRWPSLGEAARVLAGSDRKSTARQATAVGKGVLASLLGTRAREAGWNEHMLRFFLPLLVALYEALMHLAGLMSLQAPNDAHSLECGQALSGLNPDIELRQARRDALVLSPDLATPRVSTIQETQARTPRRGLGVRTRAEVDPAPCVPPGVARF